MCKYWIGYQESWSKVNKNIQVKALSVMLKYYFSLFLFLEGILFLFEKLAFVRTILEFINSKLKKSFKKPF